MVNLKFVYGGRISNILPWCYHSHRKKFFTNKPSSTNVLFKLYIRYTGYTSISFTFLLSLSTETHKYMKLTYNANFIFASSYKHNTENQFSLSYSVSEKSHC